jgi:uncharacterized protein YdeI (YjbR/CyaY-like superfamily)
MDLLTLSERQAWRDWLVAHHATQSEIWLVYYKVKTGIQSIPYEASVEEALCFGWIDSLIKKLDEDRYARKFTPRKEDSRWSAVNIRRVEKMHEAGLMTEHGLRLVEVAQRNGQWGKPVQKPKIKFDIHPAFKVALEQSPIARQTFDGLAPTYQQQYLTWIALAKRKDTRDKRILESIQLLEQGQKLGLK